MSRFESTEPRRARCVAPCFVQRRGDQAEREKRRLRHVSGKIWFSRNTKGPNPDRSSILVATPHRYIAIANMHVCIKYFHRFCMCADVAHHMGDEPPQKKHTHTNHARTQRTHTRHTHTHHTRSIRALALAFMLVRPSLAPSSESLPAASAPLQPALSPSNNHPRAAQAARGGGSKVLARMPSSSTRRFRRRLPVTSSGGRSLTHTRRALLTRRRTRTHAALYAKPPSPPPPRTRRLTRGAASSRGCRACPAYGSLRCSSRGRRCGSARARRGRPLRRRRRSRTCR